jgi:hypothetical protein
MHIFPFVKKDTPSLHTNISQIYQNLDVSTPNLIYIDTLDFNKIERSIFFTTVRIKQDNKRKLSLHAWNWWRPFLIAVQITMAISCLNRLLQKSIAVSQDLSEIGFPKWLNDAKLLS